MIIFFAWLLVEYRDQFLKAVRATQCFGKTNHQKLRRGRRLRDTCDTKCRGFRFFSFCSPFRKDPGRRAFQNLSGHG